MRVVNIHEAEADLSRLLDDVAAGEEIVIARSGRPVARLVPLSDSLKPREFGRMRGTIHLADDFDEPLPPEAVAAFEGDAPAGERCEH